MKKLLLLLVTIILPLLASADAVEIDGIYYNLMSKGNFAEVTSSPSKYTGSIVIPESVNFNNETYSVTSIGASAFSNCTSLTSIFIPNSVTLICSNAFYACTGLTSLEIPNSVTEIDAQAFRGCTSLISIEIPNSVTVIENSVFYNCSSLTSITIPINITNISDYTFSNCSALTSITIPYGVTTIGKNAFEKCASLKSIEIPNSVTRIGQDAFLFCTSLTSINIPNSVYRIDNSAFSNCTSLTSINLPNSVTILGTQVFTSCKALTSFTIPNNWTGIPYRTFAWCSGLTSCTIPNNVTSIGDQAFMICNALTSITIPNSVTLIGDYSFENCSELTSVTIGNGIKNIGTAAFKYCPKLADVTCYAESIPNTTSDAFDYSYIEYATLHVPSASINAYKSATPWNNFKDIVAIDGETPTAKKCEKPTISYENGQLVYASATEGVDFVSEITDSDIKKNYEAIVPLTATYNITVYATKSGYDNSEVSTATICWIDASPETEGIINGVAQLSARPVLVKSDNGFITVEGIDDKTNVCIYSADGKKIGSAISHNNIATIATSIQPGSIAIVKVGDKSIKVIM